MEHGPAPKVSLRGGKQERKKRKNREKQNQSSNCLLPLQRIRHHFTSHHRMQSLNTISEAYFDFKDSKSLSKFKRGILLNISTTRNPNPVCHSNFWIPWCQAELQLAEQQQFCYRIMAYKNAAYQCHHTDQTWNKAFRTRQAIASTATCMYTEKHCSTYTSQIPIIPYFRLVD